LASVWSKLSNQPSPANAGAFVKQYMTYLKDLNDNANQVVQDKIGRVIESKKNVLGDENYKTLNEQYLNPVQEKNAESSAKTVVKKGYNPKTDQTQLIYSDGSKEIVQGRQ
jgi:hypothetical protein